MGSPVISIQGLGKKYRLRRQTGQQYRALRDVIADYFLRKATEASKVAPHEDFWALRDVSFDIPQGQVVGIIGRNGAGKSTLLKILSQIVEPSTGRVRIEGRVASLLEVGTGFHPELTGRENVFLNGAILGMSRQEIKRKFDDIVAFAEVEKFLDTPVKHYSSGMYVRLAFAVAAHLDPEILVVDEVLAVGDVEFQKKCLGKMQDVSRAGRTVIFVSHNAGAISSLCERGVLLSGGQVAFDGSASEALAMYSKVGGIPFLNDGAKMDGPRVLTVTVDDEAAARGELVVQVTFDSPRPLTALALGVVVANGSRAPVFGFNTTMDPDFAPPSARSGTIQLHVSDVPLHTGLYTVSIWFGDKAQNYAVIPDAATFHLIADGMPVPAGVSLDVIGNTRVSGRFSMVN